MTTKIQRATERGYADHGWLRANHSFSFANWYEPSKMHFGAMRVLNDDFIAGGKGFGTHPHDNMEIVTIPLKGAIAHKDSTGTEGIIKKGDVQIMSAGTGIMHSEYNASPSEDLNLFQVWIFPKVKDIEPRYQQKSFTESDRKNKWQIVVSPDENDGGVWINQDAVFSLSKIDENTSIRYTTKFQSNGIYIMVIDGQITVNQEELNKRDAIEIYGTDDITLHATTHAEVLLIEVPMNS
jgi:redox-sensitive bicupin YhaK (pirin superfamily)